MSLCMDTENPFRQQCGSPLFGEDVRQEISELVGGKRLGQQVPDVERRVEVLRVFLVDAGRGKDHMAMVAVTSKIQDEITAIDFGVRQSVMTTSKSPFSSEKT